MKTICTYHSRDLDGIMSAAIVKKWYGKATNDYNDEYKVVAEGGDQLDFLGWNYGDKIPDLSEYNKIIMCDISFPVDVMDEFTSTLAEDFIWIDHHKSAINDNKSIEWEDEDYRFPFGIRDTNKAACELTWEYFFPRTKMPGIVWYLGMYDGFRHKGIHKEQTVLKFQYAARAKITNPQEAFWYLERWGDFSMTPGFLRAGEEIYNYLCIEAKQIYDNTFPATIKGYKFAVVNRERFNPVNFEIDYHADGYDGFACFSYTGKKWTWSLYNDNGKVDVSEIAKSQGGGGHKGAAGFVQDNLNLLI